MAGIAAFPLLCYSALWLFGFAMGFSYKDGRSRSFNRFAETHWKGSKIRLYRTDGGATTDSGVVIRQERTLIPGLLLVRRLDDFYPCGLLDAESTDKGITVRNHGTACTGLKETSRDYPLKRFLYF